MAEQQQPKFRIQDNPSVIETYANKFLGSVFDGGAVTLTFGSLRVSLEKSDEGPTQGQQPVIQITHRLTLSPAAAVELITGLNATLTALRQAQAQRVAQQSGQATAESFRPSPEDDLELALKQIRTGPAGRPRGS